MTRPTIVLTMEIKNIEHARTQLQGQLSLRKCRRTCRERLDEASSRLSAEAVKVALVVWDKASELKAETGLCRNNFRFHLQAPAILIALEL